jgi:sodium-dependent dicarboxylate transporter 2/3/5
MLKENLLLLPERLKMEEKESSSVMKKKSWWKQCQFFWRKHIYLPIVLGPLVGFCTIFIAMLCDMEHPMAKTLGLAAGMMTWWLEGSIRMGITGLVPIIFLPMMGVASGTAVAQSYFSDSVVVCMGSLIMASAVEKYELHHRAAKYLLKYARKHGISGILFTFIGVTGFLSMWLSNTATAALMIPLSNAVFDYLKEHPELHQGVSTLEAGAAIDLGIAFAASLGGMSTITGTGSNLVLQGTMSSLFGDDGEVTFVSWFIIAAPLTLINLFLLWILLGFCFLWKSYIPQSSLVIAWRKFLKRHDSDAKFSQ